MSSTPCPTVHHHSSGAWGILGCGRLKQNRAAKLVQSIGGSASAGWQMARFVLYDIALSVVGGGRGWKRMQNFPMMGFRGMWTLRHMEKDALLCKRKPVKMQPVNLSCCSRRGHRHVLPRAAAGEMSSALPAFVLSAVLLSSYLCARAAVHVLSPQPAEGGCWSPRRSGSRRLRDVILLAQVTQLVKTRADCPGVTPCPVLTLLLPISFRVPKVPPVRRMRFFFPFFFEAHLELKSDWFTYPCKVKLLLLEIQQAPCCGVASILVETENTNTAPCGTQSRQ